MYLNSRETGLPDNRIYIYFLSSLLVLKEIASENNIVSTTL